MNSNKKNPICPKCNSIIIEENDLWICSNVKNKKCNFKMPNTRNGRKLDIDMLVKYQNSEGHDNMAKSASNNFKYCKEERLKQMNLTDEQLKLYNEGTILTGCPLCAKRPIIAMDELIGLGRIFLIDDTVQCINNPHRCSFKMKSSYGGVTFDIEELRNMIYRGTSNIHIFKDEKTGERKKGVVKLDKSIIGGLTTVQPKYLFVEETKKDI